MERIELWLCDDCMIAEVNGDYSGLDYSYGEREAEQREREINEGLHDLHKQGGLWPDDFDSSDPDSLQRECRACGHIGHDADFPEATIDDEVEHLCPKCGSDNTVERDDGRASFSWQQCDCCGSTLGGSRTRFALFPRT